MEMASEITGGNAIIDVQFAVNALDLSADSIDRDDQRLGDLGIGLTGGQEAEHALLLSA